MDKRGSYAQKSKVLNSSNKKIPQEILEGFYIYVLDTILFHFHFIKSIKRRLVWSFDQLPTTNYQLLTSSTSF